MFEQMDCVSIPVPALALGAAALLLLAALLVLLAPAGAGRHRQQAEDLQRLLEWRQAQLQWLIARLRELEQQVQAMLASQERPAGRLRLDERGTLIEEN